MRPEKIPCFKFTAKIVLIGLILQIIPISAYATGGAVPQPEFAKFTPVSSKEMVNDFTGSFTYNIPVLTVPGPNGSGYSVSLAYNSNHSPSEDASWVGYGWNLNVGSLLRMKKGFPDDYKDTEVIYWNRTRPNITVTENESVGFEAWSNDLDYEKKIIDSVKAVEGAVVQGAYDLIAALGYIDQKIYNTYNGYNQLKGYGLNLNGHLLNDGTRYAGSLGLQHSWTKTGENDWNFDVGAKNIIESVFNTDYLSSFPWDSPFGSDRFTNGIWNSLMNNIVNVNSLPSLNRNLDSKGRGEIPTNSIKTVGKEFSDPISFRLRYSETYKELDKTDKLCDNAEWGTGIDFDDISHDKRIQVTYTANGGKSPERCYGYMYSGDVDDASKIMDYYLENDDNSYTPRDRSLPIPFSNADYFLVSGNGLNGGFRLYNKKVGHFRPNYTKSITDIQIGTELNVDGYNYGFGKLEDDCSDEDVILDLGFGNNGTNGKAVYFQTELFPKKYFNDYFFAGSDEGDEPYYFRFTNDLGGDINYYPDGSNFEQKPHRAKILYGSYLDKVMPWNVQPDNRNGRSSYIGYNINKDVKPEYRNNYNRNLKTYSVDEAIAKSDDNNMPAYTLNEIPNNANFTHVNQYGIAEFCITNESGMKYTYGLPVYYRNERNFSYGITKIATYNFNANNRIIYKNITTEKANNNDENYSIIGHEMNEPYAGMYLLTSITTPDYVDLTNDGPTPDDIGGWTKFNYMRTAGSNEKKDPYVEQWANEEGYSSNSEIYNSETDIYPLNKSPKELNDAWYKWRKPYSGLYYNRNYQSDPRDDEGSFSMGEKEIYYLESIETKTHIAYFINNKSEFTVTYQGDSHTITAKNPITGLFFERQDGFEADHNEYVASGTQNVDLSSSENKLRYLRRIELYSKAYDYESTKNLTKLLQTVNFDYDYSAWPGEPNSINEAGKLTLKAVWTDFEDIVNNEIHPYSFDYGYHDYPYPGVMTSGTDMDNYGSGLNQYPSFQEAKVDRWGAYQVDVIGSEEESKYRQEFPWVYQKEESGFDPAAWHLKEITLPSGGQIHVQYEQNEYTTVQNKESAVMAKIESYNHPNLILDLDETLDIEDGVEGDAIMEDIVNLLNRKHNKPNSGKDSLMFFRFLYALTGGLSSANLHNCRSEYISGYTKIENVEQLSDHKIKIVINNELPKEICQDFAVHKRNGILFNDHNCNCDPAEKDIDLEYESVKDAENRLSSFNALDADDFCKALNPEYSYVRILLPNELPKKGGGVRVKRLLMYDPFDDITKEETPRLYGTEYVYKGYNYQENKWFNSGVAANEPELGSEENSLVDYISKRTGQSDNEEYYAGRDLKQFSGPYGKSIMPNPSVSYSDVIVKNIYDGISSPGFVYKKYNTYRDFPFSDGFSKTTALNISPFTGTRDLPFYMSVVEEFYTSQGFCFKTNHMHGQPKEVLTYSGIFNDPSTWTEGVKTNYDYFQEDEKIPVMYDLSDHGQDSYIDWVNLGREMELVNESRTIISHVKKFDSEWDLNWDILPWKGMENLWPSPSGSFRQINNKQSFFRHVNSKIIDVPALVKRVTTTTPEGIKAVAENLAFDPYTGRPVLTRTTDGYDGLIIDEAEYGGAEHDGAYYNFSIMGSAEYPQLGQKASNEKLLFQSTDSYDLIRRYSIDINDQADDNDDEDEDEYYIKVRHKDFSCQCNLFESFTPGDLIAVKASGEARGPGYEEYYHITEVQDDMMALIPLYDNSEYDIPYGEMKVDIEVIRSGKTNQLSAAVGGFATYGTTDTDEDNWYNYNGDILKYPDAIGAAHNGHLPLIEAGSRGLLCNILNSAITYTETNYSGVPFVVDLSTLWPSGSVLEINLKDPNGNSLIIDESNIDDYITITRDYKEPIIDCPLASDGEFFWEFDICFNRSIEGTNSSQSHEHPLVTDLNNWLNRSYSIDLNEEIPGYDWFCYNSSRDESDEVEMGANSDQRYVMRKIKDKSLIKKIDDLTGLTRIFQTIYELYTYDNESASYELNEYQGNKLLQKEYEEEIYVMLDQYEQKVFIGAYSLKFRQFYTDNTSWPTNWWFGIKRQLFWEEYYKDVIDGYNTGFYIFNCAFYPCRNYAWIDLNPLYDGVDGSWWVSESDGTPESILSETDKSYARTFNEGLISDAENGIVAGSTFVEKAFSFINDEGDLNLSVANTNIDNPFDDGSAKIKLFIDVFDEDKCCMSLVFGETVIGDNTNPQVSPQYYTPFQIINGKLVFLPAQTDGYHYTDNDMDELEDNNNNQWHLQTCCSNEIACIDFYENTNPNRSIDGVIATNAISLSDDWEHGIEPYPLMYNSDDKYATGEKGRWWNDKSYIYKDEIIQGIDHVATPVNQYGAAPPSQTIYNNAGVFKNDYTMFNWRYPEGTNYKNIDNSGAVFQEDNGWITTSWVTKYSPEGNPLEVNNIMDIPGTTLYGYGSNIPVLVAQNAEYGTVRFKSFDDPDALGSFTYEHPDGITGTVALDESIVLDNTVAHSGYYSRRFDYDLPSGYYEPILDNVIVTEKTLDQGYLIQFWVKAAQADQDILDYDISTEIGGVNFLNLNVVDVSDINTPLSVTSINPEKIAKTGEWTLFSAVIEQSALSNAGLSVGDKLRIDLYTSWKHGDLNAVMPFTIWLDDIRCQPVESEMMAYVYDRDYFRLVTSFDDQHFGLYYQYNEEGKLKRKIIETVRGLKTIAETNYHMPIVYRSSAVGTPFGSINQNNNNLNNTSGSSGYGRYLQNKRNANPEKQGIETKFDILNIELTPDKQNIKIFDVNSDKIEVDSLNEIIKGIERPEFTEPELDNAVEQIKDFQQDSLEIIKGLEVDSSKLNLPRNITNQEVPNLDQQIKKGINENNIENKQKAKIKEKIKAVEDKKIKNKLRTK